MSQPSLDMLLRWASTAADYTRPTADYESTRALAKTSAPKGQLVISNNIITLLAAPRPDSEQPEVKYKAWHLPLLNNLLSNLTSNFASTKQ